MEISFQISGGDQLRAKLEEAGPLAVQALAAAMYNEMDQRIIPEAKNRTPVDTGILLGSGVTLPPEVVGNVITVVGGFGGAASGYSIPVHERLDVHHEVGEAKFLENAFNDALPGLIERLGRRLDIALRRLKGA